MNMEKSMTNGIRLLLLLGLAGSLLLSGCTTMVYGVPKEQWQHMSPAEQQQVRAEYMERRRLTEERRLYEAKRRAHEAEIQAQQARDEPHPPPSEGRPITTPRPVMPSHVPPPSRQGQAFAGAPSVIHLTLKGGTVYTAGRHHPYRPITVELHQGQSKRLELLTTDERKPRKVVLFCSYDKGQLTLGNGKSHVHALQFNYERQWLKGQRYQRLAIGGGVGLQGGELLVRSGDMAGGPDSRRSTPAPVPASRSRSTTDIRNEQLRRREQAEPECRDARGRLIKPGQAGNCAEVAEPPSQDKRITVPAVAPMPPARQTDNANRGDAQGKPPHRPASPDENGGTGQNGESRNANRQDAAHTSPGRGDGQDEAKGKGKDKDPCQDDAGNKGKRADCDDEAPAGNARAKGQ